VSFRYHLVDTRSGTMLVEIYPKSGTCSRALNAGGRGSHDFLLPFTRSTDSYTPDFTPLVDKSLTRPWARTLVVSWKGIAVYAGVITERTFVDDTSILTVKTEDIRAIFERRYPFGVAGYYEDAPLYQSPGRLDLRGLSLRASVVRILQESLIGPFSIWSLPIDLPDFASEPGGNTDVIENFKLVDTAALLENYQDRSGGPDIDFEPRWVNGQFRWFARIGGGPDPMLYVTPPEGGPVEFNMSAPQRRLTGVKITESGRQQATGQFSVGVGSGRDMKVGGAGLEEAATIPALDIVRNYKEQDDKTILNSYSIGALEVIGNTTTQYEFGMLADEEPGLENLRMGTLHALFWYQHPWIDDGKVNLRLIGMSMNTAGALTLDSQLWR
jgi:hypothetical protein